MSYILDALKKADQQRQRGATPSLRSAPQIMPKERKSSVWRFVVLAMVLVAAGALFAGWQTWDSSGSSDSQSVAANTATSATSATTAPPRVDAQPSAPTSFPVMPSTPAPPLPLPDPLPNPTPAKPAPNALAHATPPAVAAEPQPDRILMIDELPLSVRQSLPAMTVSLHAWSATPTSRIVSINNKLLHEGDSPAAGVSLEEITPDGMIMTFSGYRFRHGVR